MDIEAPLDLQAIYSPIQAEMHQLARFLKEEFSSSEPFLVEILQHVARYRGKQIRPALFFLAGRLSGRKSTERQVQIAAVIELIHTATLVHDDVLDDALLRRRVETVHRRWGERAAVLVGDYIYSRAFHLSTRVPGMAAILSDTTHTICEGELLQIGCQHREVDEATYLEIIRKKTAVLYDVSCRIGGMLSGLDESSCGKLGEFGTRIGMAFQIIDDCLDYLGDEAFVGKSLGTDLRLGKMTLPLIYLMRSLTGSERERLRGVVRGSAAPADRAWVHELMASRGVAAEVFTRAEAFAQAGKEVLEEILPGDPRGSEAKESLELVADYVVRRQR